MTLGRGRKTFLLFALYTLMCYIGAGILMVIESKGTKISTEERHQDIASEISSFMNKSLSLRINTSTANVLVEQISKYIEAKEKSQGNEWKSEINWMSLSRWRYFVGVTTTTVGYGDICPSTTGAKVFVIFYSLICIPICMLMIASVGSLLCYAFGKLKNRVLNAMSGENKERSPTIYCVIQCTIISISYVVIVGLLLAKIEGWAFFDGIYWAFVTFTTIGYGDFTPTVVGAWYSEALTLLSIIGLAFVAMTFDVALKVLEQGTKKQKKVETSIQMKQAALSTPI